MKNEKVLDILIAFLCLFMAIFLVFNLIEVKDNSLFVTIFILLGSLFIKGANK